MVPGNDGDRWRDRLYYPVSDLGFVGEVNAMKKRISVFLTVILFMPGMCLSGMGGNRKPACGSGGTSGYRSKGEPLQYTG